ncbi:MAG: 2OG-Fe(II) oxygenase [Proteobacteria bacterium]|nr:2OG-Fe(II) oxygenase [Pseudomonadota bacterium]
MAAGDAAVAAALAGPGWAVVPAYLPALEVAALVAAQQARELAGEFRPAAVGAGQSRALRPEIRSDRIAWLQDAQCPAEAALLARLEALRVTLNRRLLLGLDELECQYAVYDPGAGYARHLDRSPRGAERVVSWVLYLNVGWQPGDGGELVLSTPAGEHRVEPRAGVLVTFLSAELAHEVRPAARPRLSLAGWFRRRPLPATVR